MPLPVERPHALEVGFKVDGGSVIVDDYVGLSTVPDFNRGGRVLLVAARGLTKSGDKAEPASIGTFSIRLTPLRPIAYIGKKYSVGYLDPLDTQEYRLSIASTDPLSLEHLEPSVNMRVYLEKLRVLKGINI